MNTQSSMTLKQQSHQILILMLLVGGTHALSAAIKADTKDAENPGFIQQSEEQKQNLSNRWGIELVAMRSTAFGHMLDFRYRVLDAEKAAPIFERKIKPYLIHQGSGKALAVPNTAKLGSLRNSNMPQQGRTYWMFFGNNHGLVKKGDKVTVAIGDFRAIDLEVE